MAPGTYCSQALIADPRGAASKEVDHLRSLGKPVMAGTRRVHVEIELKPNQAFPCT